MLKAGIVPVTITGIIDSTHYQAYRQGAWYELFTSSAASLAVGDLVMARWVPGANQLFLPVASTTSLFAAPGRNLATGLADLYKRNSDGSWSLWVSLPGDNSGPPDEVCVTFAFWWPTKNKFYVCVADPNGPSRPEIFDVGVSSATYTSLSLGTTLAPSGASNANFIIGAMIVGNYAYLVGSRYDSSNKATVWQFDGTAVTVVDSVTTNITPDLIAGVYDGTTLYWMESNSGDVRQSSDGTTWSADATLSNISNTGRALYNSAVSKIHVAGYDYSLTPDDAIVFQRNGSWATNQAVNDTAAADAYTYGIGLRYSSNGGTPSKEYVFWRQASPSAHSIWTRDADSSGVYSQDGDAPALTFSGGTGKFFGTLGGSIFLIGVPDGGTTSRIWSRSSDSGSWTQEADLSGYTKTGSYDVLGLYEAGISLSPDRF